jgi:hypothetical protein
LRVHPKNRGNPWKRREIKYYISIFMVSANRREIKIISACSHECHGNICVGEMVKDVQHIREQLDGEEEKANRATLAHVCPPLLDEVTLLRKELNRIGSRLNEEEGGGQDASAAEEEPGAGPPSPRAAGGGAKKKKPAGAGSRVAGPGSPPMNPYEEDPRIGAHGKSKYAEQQEAKKASSKKDSRRAFRSEMLHSDNDDEATLNWWPSGRASAPSAPESP